MYICVQSACGIMGGKIYSHLLRLKFKPMYNGRVRNDRKLPHRV